MNILNAGDLVFSTITVITDHPRAEVDNQAYKISIMRILVRRIKFPSLYILHGVVAGTAVKRVVAGTAVKRVVALFAVKFVVAAAARKHVVAAAAVKHVVAAAARKHVVVGGTGDTFVTVSACKHHSVSILGNAFIIAAGRCSI